MSKLAPYRKFIFALVGAIVTVVAQFYGANSAVQIVVAVLTALGVYQVPNVELKG